MAGGMMGGATAGSMPMRGNAPAGTSTNPTSRLAQAAPTADCPPVSQKIVDAGRAIFSGAGNCFACHGAKAKGTPLAPDLTDKQWLDIDGSYASIVGLVRSGVPKPKQYAAPMPAMGGASLSSSQLCAVAAYVYSLSHS
jgi:mono/diheme cytochrome c family protein